MRRPLLVNIYLMLTALAPTALEHGFKRLHSRQGADPKRVSERFGHAGLPRPDGRLIWIHASSVGEVTSVSKLAREIMSQTGASLLITTMTATGGQIVARNLPEALHQFLPVDTPAAVDRFLAYWQPAATFFVEGDLWPRMISKLAGSDIPIALLNARSSRSRKRFRRSFEYLLAPMALITVQDEKLRNEFITLGVDEKNVKAPGNLKTDIEPLSVNKERCAQIAASATDRWVWAAVSTHPAEEEVVLDAYAQLPGNPVLVLVPRHPDRGNAVADMLVHRGLHFTRESAGEIPQAETQVHLVDVLGETGFVYSAAKLAFIGGSLFKGIGGHTPYEPAMFDCGIISGPHVDNFSTAYTELRRMGAAREAQDAQDLSNIIIQLMSDPEALANMQRSARKVQQLQSGAAKRTMALIDQMLRHR